MGIVARMASTGASKQSAIARRAEIVRAAATVFRAKGVAATSIDDVARAAGADRATLYYYVGSKNELFQEVVLSAVVGNIELAERIAAGDDSPTAKLEALILGVMASYAEFYP